jgi:hypothetical protein
MTSTSSSESEHDQNDQDYKPHCMRTLATALNGVGPSVVVTEGESTWDYGTGHLTSP